MRLYADANRLIRERNQRFHTDHVSLCDCHVNAALAPSARKSLILIAGCLKNSTLAQRLLKSVDERKKGQPGECGVPSERGDDDPSGSSHPCDQGYPWCRP